MNSLLGVKENGEIVRLRDIIIVATFIWLISYYIHSPLSGDGTSVYSDIVGLLFSRGIVTADRLLIPYKDYHLEYPPLVALLFILSNLAILLVPKENIFLRAFIGYTVMSIVLYLHAIGVIIILHKLAKYVERKNIHILLYFVLMPSFLIYTNYNWDLIGIFYALLGLYLFLKNKKILSAVMFGFAAAGKLIPAIIALGPATQLFVEELESLKRKKERTSIFAYITAMTPSVMYLLIVVGVFIAWNAPFMLIDFDGWYSGMIAHHANWYVEDSWLILVFDPFNPLAKFFSAFTMMFLLVISLYLLVTANINRERRVIIGGTLCQAVFLFSTYVYTPQMNLLILPLLALVPIDYVVVFIFDALNAMIILSWFNFQNIYWLFGIETKYGPLDRISIPQIAAWARCFILFFIIIKIFRFLSGSSTFGTRKMVD